MYKITKIHDKNELCDGAVTIDAAIEAAKKASLDPEVAPDTVAVRDASIEGKGRIRVMAKNGRAHWVDPCKKCKATGQTGAWVPTMFGGQMPEFCAPCSGTGHIEGLPCA